MAIKIFIDQGHNPSNPNAGAEGNGLREQDLTYKIGTATAELLRNDPAYEVRLSRNSPTESLGTSNSTSLAARVDEANAWGADRFISLHANASTNTSASGTEGYVYSTDSAGYPLSQNIVAAVSEATGLADRGIFENEIYPGIPDLLKEAKHKGVHLAIASSKPTVFVERILKYFKIYRYFDVVIGSELDGSRSRKEEVVEELARR